MSHTRPLLIASTLALFAVPLQALAQIAAPTGVDASDGTLTDGIALSWDAVDEASSYRVYRRLGTTSLLQVGTTSEPAFLDTTALPGRLFEYVVRAIADEVVVMHRGTVVESGPKSEMFTPPHHDYTDLLLSSIPEMDPDWLDKLLADAECAGHPP